MSATGYDIDEMLARQQETFAQAKKEAEAEAQNPFGCHRWVRLAGLQTADLNGRCAEIVVRPNADDRFGVRVQGEVNKKLIKRSNLQPISDAETVCVCRIAAAGEDTFSGGYIQDTRWPLAMLEAMPYAISPVSVRLGFPLRLTRVEPRSELRKRSDYDNQWATYLMIQVESGLAVDAWQSQVGPVVVWRPGSAVSSDDMCLLNDFLSNLLDRYSDDEAFRPERDITPEAWARARDQLLHDQQLNPHLQQYTNLNI